MIKTNLKKAKQKLPTHKKGFTLAEVLITLAIIGIVAALTIPTLVASIQNNQLKIAYKKAFRDASIAWMEAFSDGTLQERPGWVSDPSCDYNFNQFMAKFTIIKQCSGSVANTSGCWAPNEDATVVWGLPNTGLCFIDTSGRSWCKATNWGWMIVDTNGFKEPNIFGKDRFPLYTAINNSTSAAGIPNSIFPFEDQTAVDVHICPSPPCYYTSWLTDTH